MATPNNTRSHEASRPADETDVRLPDCLPWAKQARTLLPLMRNITRPKEAKNGAVVSFLAAVSALDAALARAEGAESIEQWEALMALVDRAWLGVTQALEGCGGFDWHDTAWGLLDGVWGSLDRAAIPIQNRATNSADLAADDSDPESDASEARKSLMRRAVWEVDGCARASLLMLRRLRVAEDELTAACALLARVIDMANVLVSGLDDDGTPLAEMEGQVDYGSYLRALQDK